MKKSRSTIRIVVTLLLVGMALHQAGLLNEEGRKTFYILLDNTNYYFVGLSFLLTFLLNLASAIKWKMLLVSKKIHVSLARVYAYYNIGKFFNLILPTSMGGDVVRIFQLGNYTGDKHTAAASVIVERFTGLVTLLLFALLAVIINLSLFQQLWLTVSLGAGCLALIIVTWLVFSQTAFTALKRFSSNRHRVVDNLVSKVEKIRKPVMEFKDDRKAMHWALLNSVIFQFLAVVNVWISALAFSNEIDFMTCLLAVPVILFIMNIPFSIGGIGLMEFGFVFTFSLFLVSPPLALSTALLIRAKGIIDSLLGGILYLYLNGFGKNLPKPQS